VHKEDRTNNYYNPRRTGYAVLRVTSFTVTYSNSHKSLLKYETEYDMSKIAQKL